MKKQEKIKTRQLCVIAMLLAITVVLSYLSGYLRIGTFAKFSISFISVYVAAALYGKWAGGFVGAGADIVSCIGMYVPNIYLLLISFVYGFLFGVFFDKRKEGKYSRFKASCKVIIYSLITTLSDIFIKTLILLKIDSIRLEGVIVEKYNVALIMRLPGCIIMMLVMIFVLMVFELCYIEKFRKLI